MSIHAARAWNWYEAAQGSDKTGPLAGVPYDGKLTKADGKGTWWEGYDPQDLYAQNHAIGAEPDAAYIAKFVNRTKDLMEKYHPDLVFFDDTKLPLGDAGLNIAAHYYNTNPQWNGGKLQSVIICNGLTVEEQRGSSTIWNASIRRTCCGRPGAKAMSSVRGITPWPTTTGAISSRRRSSIILWTW